MKILGRTTLRIAMAMILASLVLTAQQPRAARAGRFDAQIEQDVAKLLEGNKQFANVRYGVEDAIVTLEGKVELHSQRTALENQVRGIKHVAGVRSYLVLDPTPVPDEQLFGRVRSALQNANLGQLTVKAHEGRVVVSGDVQNRRQWSRAVNLVWDTAGVKEAEFQIRVLGEQQ
jgi:osmotically-inducible protein OsmY